MKRNIPDINTPDNYEKIYFGTRTIELRAHKEIIDLLSELNHNKGNVLDIGCGLGRYFPAFKGSQIYGTELSIKVIEKTKHDYPDAHLVQWFAGTPLPYLDNFFNLIWCGEFLEHINDPQQAIEEIYRVLTYGGVALFMTPIGTNSQCPEHLWFLDQQEIEGFFAKYEHKQIITVANNTRFRIILRK